MVKINYVVQPNMKGFSRTLRKRVKAYFQEKNISEKGNWQLYSKTILILTIYITSYLLIIGGGVSVLGLLFLCIIMGICKAAIGLNIMHDANHNSYSSNTVVNKYLGYALDFIGGNKFNWCIKHNIHHHTHTNVHGHDEDISSGYVFLRFSPFGEKYSWHRYQHVYAPFLYSLTTLRWLFSADFVRLSHYNSSGLTEQLGYDPRRELLKLLVGKAFYFSYILLPLFLLDISIIQYLVGFILMNIVASIVLTISFVAGHIVECSLYPLPDDNDQIQNDWYAHQLFVTANFSMRNRFLTAFIGGLNYQIEHHLFPNISHIHYPAIAPIVKETAREFGIPYHEFTSIKSILRSHFGLLKKLGRD